MDTWSEAIGYIKQEPYFAHILQAVAADRALYTVYPPKSDVFSAFRLTDWNKLKVVILGQDPYHGPNQANGLAFSVIKRCLFLLLYTIFMKSYRTIFLGFRFLRMVH